MKNSDEHLRTLIPETTAPASTQLANSTDLSTTQEEKPFIVTLLCPQDPQNPNPITDDTDPKFWLYMVLSQTNKSSYLISKGATVCRLLDTFYTTAPLPRLGANGVPEVFSLPQVKLQDIRNLWSQAHERILAGCLCFTLTSNACTISFRTVTLKTIEIYSVIKIVSKSIYTFSPISSFGINFNNLR